VIEEEDRIEEISIISLIRLMEGGAAILVATNKNHHMDIVGKMFSSPFVRNNLREDVDS